MRNNSLNAYFKSIKKYPLLSKQQEVELAKKIEKGDLAAKQLMIKSNLRLAISIAKKYAKYGHDLEDLIQESNIGLIKAIDKFDWRKGFKFSTYASWWIKQAATRSLTSNASLLKIPSHTVAGSRKVIAAIKDYQEEFGSDPKIEEIADVLNTTVDNVKTCLSAIDAKYVLSLYKPFSDQNNRSLADVIPDPSISIEDVIDNQTIRKQIIQSFDSLTKREELIIRLRFGITETIESDNNIYLVEEGE